MKNKVIAIPMGDPCGIGPEIVLKALMSPLLKDAVVVVAGDTTVFTYLCGDYHLKNPFDRVIENDLQLDQALNDNVKKILYHLPLVDMSRFSFKVVSEMGGNAAYRSIEKCVDLALNSRVDALATTPINKESLKAAKIKAIGHTEILGELTGAPSPVTMFETLGLHIFFMTRHLSLRDACDAVTFDRVYEFIHVVDEITREQGFDQSVPLAVAALNPHGGEHGLFGNEEMEHIVPAVSRCREEGINVVGPIGADSVFHLAKIGKYKAVLSLYHDQGHIAAKTLDFERTISVTWKLPFLRTSVDHGTAFDIAGENRASEVSMVEAVNVALSYLG
ncbi:MAG: 4-hydroxythreonine-4-phosphate dehydrogenase PdxA [Sphaerochaetaceae bacterium]|nr:4-hydroxythreonine-4-phosphate dehydrogenase PdxA [Sphaerochaetaceae bacterium]